jgi:hypothetical protein
LIDLNGSNRIAEAIQGGPIEFGPPFYFRRHLNRMAEAGAERKEPFQNLSDAMAFCRSVIHGTLFGSTIQNRGRDKDSSID